MEGTQPMVPKKSWKMIWLYCLTLCLIISVLNYIKAGDPIAAAEMFKFNTSATPTPTPIPLIKLAVITCTDTVNIPTAGSIEWYVADIPGVIRQAIRATYTDNKYFTIPNEAITDALSKNGYDMNALEMPDKTDIIKIATDLNADAALVIEVSSLGVMVSKTSFQFYVSARYRAYLAKNQRFILRRFIYEGPQFSIKLSAKEQKAKLTETISATVNSILANCMFDRDWK